MGWWDIIKRGGYGDLSPRDIMEIESDYGREDYRHLAIYRLDDKDIEQMINRAVVKNPSNIKQRLEWQREDAKVRVIKEEIQYIKDILEDYYTPEKINKAKEKTKRRLNKSKKQLKEKLTDEEYNDVIDGVFERNYKLSEEEARGNRGGQWADEVWEMENDKRRAIFDYFEIIEYLEIIEGGFIEESRKRHLQYIEKLKEKLKEYEERASKKWETYQVFGSAQYRDTSINVDKGARMIDEKENKIKSYNKIIDNIIEKVGQKVEKEHSKNLKEYLEDSWRKTGNTVDNSKEQKKFYIEKLRENMTDAQRKEHQNMINNVQKRKEEIDSLKRQYPELKDYTGETTKTTRSQRKFQEKAKRQKKEMQRRKELGRSVEPKTSRSERRSTGGRQDSRQFRKL